MADVEMTDAATKAPRSSGYFLTGVEMRVGMGRMVGVAVLVDMGKSTCGGLALDEFDGMEEWSTGDARKIRTENGFGSHGTQERTQSDAGRINPRPLALPPTTPLPFHPLPRQFRPPNRLHPPNADMQPLLLSPHRLPLRNEQGPTNHRHPEEVPTFSQEGYPDVRGFFFPSGELTG
jgi:hypothetical protein